MFIARVRRDGFTLIEVTLAVAILAMMSLAIYRFVESNMTSIRISAEQDAAEARYSGLLNFLTEQLQSLPAASGALSGEPFKFNDRPRDEITWICSAGPGLLTRYAAGEFVVSLRLKPVPAKGDRMEMGLARKRRGEQSDAETWVPLLDNVRSLQIRYFDSRINSWVDKWTDAVTLPRLVRFAIGLPDRSTPWEAVVALRRTPL